MTSRPLFISVAESIVILPPMSQVGCCSACSTVTDSSSARERPRNGPPDAVRTSLSIVPRRPCSAPISWCSAECSESTGMICAPVASASAVTSSPPTTSDSLLASARSMPSVSATIVGPRPAEPTIALSTRSASAFGDQLDEPLRPGEHLALGPRLRRAGRGVGVRQRDPAHAVGARLRHQRRRARCPAERPTTSNSSPARATTSSACVPIDPVEPRMRSRFIGDPLWQRLSKGRMKARADAARAGARTTARQQQRRPQPASTSGCRDRTGSR